MSDEAREPKNGNGGNGVGKWPDKRPAPVDQYPIEFNEWPTASQVAKQIKCSVRTVMRLVNAGTLSCVRDTDGVKRFDPALVQDYHLVRENFGNSLDEEDDEEQRNDSRRREEDRRDKTLNSSIRRLDSVNELVDTLITGVQRFINIVAGPAERLLEKHDKVNRVVMDRNEYLENMAFRMLKNQEEMLNEREARDLARKVFDASESRKSEAWKLIMDRAPRLLNQIEASILDKHPEAKAQVEAAIELLSDPEITPEMLDVLREFLSPKNRERLDKIIDPDGKKKAAAAKAKEASEQPAKDSGSASAQPSSDQTTAKES